MAIDLSRSRGRSPKNDVDPAPGPQWQVADDVPMARKSNSGKLLGDLVRAMSGRNPRPYARKEQIWG